MLLNLISRLRCGVCVSGVAGVWLYVYDTRGYASLHVLGTVLSWVYFLSYSSGFMSGCRVALFLDIRLRAMLTPYYHRVNEP